MVYNAVECNVKSVGEGCNGGKWCQGIRDAEEVVKNNKRPMNLDALVTGSFLGIWIGMKITPRDLCLQINTPKSFKAMCQKTVGDKRSNGLDCTKKAACSSGSQMGVFTLMVN